MLRTNASSSFALWAYGDATAAVAVMLAAQGISWKRKLVFAGLTAVLSIVLFEVVAHSFLGAAADKLTSSDASGTDLQLAAFVMVQVLFMGVPLALLAMFVGRKPSRLWSSAR